MKKLSLIFILLVSILAGCGDDKYISLSGESENWKGTYQANINNGTSENGNYSFKYKNGGSNTTFKNVEVIINDGETSRKEEDIRGATVKMTTSCTGCAVTRENEPIKVTIKWDDTNEETFYLK